MPNLVGAFVYSDSGLYYLVDEVLGDTVTLVGIDKSSILSCKLSYLFEQFHFPNLTTHFEQAD
jgi:hypothetical protein